MLLVVAPGKVSTAGTSSERPESEIDPRGEISTYLPYKRDRYIRKNKLSVLEATLLALKNAQNKIHDVNNEDMRLYLLYALYDVYYGKKGAYLNVSLMDRDGVTSRVEFKVSHENKHHCRFLIKDSDTFSVHLECPLQEISSMGFYHLAVKSETIKVKRTFREMYDLHEVHKLKSIIREGVTKRVVMKIPCYTPSFATRASNIGLPLTEIHLMVEISSSVEGGDDGLSATKDLKCMLVGARIVCMLQADTHQVLYTKSIHLDDNPTFDLRRAKRAGDEVDRQLLSRGGRSSNASSYSGGVVDTISSVITDFIQTSYSLSHRGEEKALTSFSWSVSHYDQVVFSHKGLDRYPIGHIGEVPFGLAVIRAAHGCSPSNWSDMNMCSPQGLEKLLQKSGSLKLLDALKSLYSRCPRLPSVLELLTHTSGLPHVGSIDCEVDMDYIEQILPGLSRGKSPTDKEGRFARMLVDRVTLVANPGSVVHHSVLGYAVLSFCFSNLHQTMKDVFSELGMDSTRMEKKHHHPKSLDQDPYHPDDETYFVSNCTTSSTNDMCRYITCIEKANLDPCAHPYLAQSLVPCYLSADHGKNGMQAICHGGMESCMIRLVLNQQCKSAKKSDRVSLNVFFKFGERQGQGSSILVWLPGLHVGFSLCATISLKNLFGRTHKEMGYHKLSTKKLFSAKHLLKCILQKTFTALSEEQDRRFDLDQEADLAYSITPMLPPHYREYALKCSTVSNIPEGPLKTLLDSSPLFKDDGIYFYPLIHAIHEIKHHVYSVPPSVSVEEDIVTAKLERIRIFKKKVAEDKDMVYFLEDSQSPDQHIQLVYDKTIEIVAGHEAAAALKLHVGCFRKVSDSRKGDLGEHVSIRVLPNNLLGIHHRGCIYISQKAIKDIKVSIETSRLRQEESLLQNSQEEEAKKWYNWKLVEASVQTELSTKQQYIEHGGHGGAGAILGAGALGFAGGAMLAGAPYYGYGGYYGYPVGPYPYPYYYRRRWY